MSAVLRKAPRLLLSVSSIWRYRTAILSRWRCIMRSVASNPEPVNLSNKMQRCAVQFLSLAIIVIDKWIKSWGSDDDYHITYSCFAHVLNLLGQDLTQSSTTEHINEVNMFFRIHYAPSAWMKSQLGSVHPQLPNDTRLHIQLISFNSFITKWTYYIT